MHYVSPATIIKEKTRRTAREWLVFCFIGALILLAWNQGQSAHPFAIDLLFAYLLFGVPVGTALWLAYRFARFIIGR